MQYRANLVQVLFISNNAYLSETCLLELQEDNDKNSTCLVSFLLKRNICGKCNSIKTTLCVFYIKPEPTSESGGYNLHLLQLMLVHVDPVPPYFS